MRILLICILLLFSAPPAFASLKSDVAGQLTGAGAQTGLGGEEISLLVARIIRATLAIAGVIFVVLMIYAGFQWMTAGGEEEKVKSAVTLIRNSLIGLIIVLTAYAVTQFVISRLVEATTGV